MKNGSLFKKRTGCHFYENERRTWLRLAHRGAGQCPAVEGSQCDVRTKQRTVLRTALTNHRKAAARPPFFYGSLKPFLLSARRKKKRFQETFLCLFPNENKRRALVVLSRGVVADDLAELLVGERHVVRLAEDVAGEVVRVDDHG